MVLGIGIDGLYDVVHLQAANFASMRYIEWSRVKYVDGLLAPRPFGLGIEGTTYGDEKKRYGINIYEYPHALAAPTLIYTVLRTMSFTLSITTELGQLPLTCYFISRDYASYGGWMSAQTGQLMKNIVIPSNTYVQNPCITYERRDEFSFITTLYTVVPTQLSSLI